MKRLNFDVDDEFHAKLKAYCASKGVDMKEEVVELISLVLEARAELSREEGEPSSKEAPDESEELEEESVPPFLKKSDQNIAQPEPPESSEPKVKALEAEAKFKEEKPAMSEKPITIYRCKRCTFATDDIGYLILHMVEEHSPKPKVEAEKKPQRMQRTVTHHSACLEPHLKCEEAVLKHKHITTTEPVATEWKKPNDEENLCPKCGTKKVNGLLGLYCPKCWGGLV